MFVIVFVADVSSWNLFAPAFSTTPTTVFHVVVRALFFGCIGGRLIVSIAMTCSMLAVTNDTTLHSIFFIVIIVLVIIIKVHLVVFNIIVSDNNISDNMTVNIAFLCIIFFLVATIIMRRQRTTLIIKATIIFIIIARCLNATLLLLLAFAAIVIASTWWQDIIVFVVIDAATAIWQITLTIVLASSSASLLPLPRSVWQFAHPLTLLELQEKDPLLRDDLATLFSECWWIWLCLRMGCVPCRRQHSRTGCPRCRQIWLVGSKLATSTRLDDMLATCRQHSQLSNFVEWRSSIKNWTSAEDVKAWSRCCLDWVTMWQKKSHLFC